MATQQITGLASGFDTASIIEQLMSIQRQSYDKVSEKVEAEKLRLQAYQSVNSMLSSFKTSANSLSSQALWNGKTATSTNESSLKATANQYAVEGSYSLRVGQLATTAQYLSKGFSSSTSTVIGAGSEKQSGTITLESSKAKVDTSAKLESLNGGSGVYRGSIRITDASGASAIVDVSTCETVDQVVSAINAASGVQVQAGIKQNDDGTSAGGQLEIVDISGGTGTMKIQNVGQGTTATDLGIAGASTDVNGVATITGSSIYYMSGNTELSQLNDGLGVEEGMMCITINNGGAELDVYVDLNNTSTVSDILNSVNSALKAAAAGDGAYASMADGLRLTVNDAGDAFAFTGGKAGCTYTIANVWGQNENGETAMAKPQTVNQLGLLGTFHVGADGGGFEGKRVFGGMSSPMLANLSGANRTGIGSEDSLPTVSADTLDADTLLKDLNGGAGISVSDSDGVNADGLVIYFYEGGGDSVRQLSLNTAQLRALATTEGATLGDLADFINRSFADCGIPGLESVELKIDSAGRGVYFDGLSSAHDYGFGGELAESLGVFGLYHGDQTSSAEISDLYAVENIGTAQGNTMLLESTKLSELSVNGADITQAQLDAMLVDGGVVIDVAGVTVSVDLSGLTGDSTVEEFYGAINAAIQDQVGAANPGANVPSLIISFNSMGLNWVNVDANEDFAVSGAAADTLGFAKNYSAQNIGTQNTGVQKNLNPVTVGTATAIDIAGGQTVSTLNAGQGLSLNGNSLTLTFGPEGNQAIVSVTRDELFSALGGNPGAATVDEYLSALNTLFNQKIGDHASLSGTGASVTFGKSADGKGITILSANGVNDGDAVALGGDMATAASTGLVAATMEGGSNFASPEAADIRGVAATPADVAGIGYIKLEIDGAEYTLDTDGITQYSTLNDLVGVLNKQLADLGFDSMSFGVSDSGTGLSFTNDSNKEVTIKHDAVSSLASDLGLVGKAGEAADSVVSAKSHLNGSGLNRNYIGRATSLSTLNGGKGADTGIITVTNAQGTAVNIDLAEAKTIGDVVDAINGSLYGVNARINDAGDGIVIEQTSDVTADGGECTGNISIASGDGTNTAEHLGIAGIGVGGEDGMSVLDGSMKTVIEVGATDTLTDLMNRIANSGDYKCSIINDGTGSNSYRLSISATSSGAASDFVIDTDLDVLGFQQVSKGQDSMLLYGQPDSGMSPVVLKSSTNSNNQAILGLTLELSEVSDSYTTINVTTDTESVVEAIQEMVQAYNDLSDLITYLDGFDYENNTKGILFGDTTIRTLMDTIDEMFYEVFNPNSLSYSDLVSTGKKSTWTWSDLGISFSANNTNSDGESGTWYSRMELDLDTLNDMVSNNWDELYDMLASQRNASNSKLASNVAASASFNFQYDLDENGVPIKPEDQRDPNNAINGDKSTSSSVNGFEANKTIAEGENEYTVYFQGATTLDRVSIYFPSAADSLKDFTVEYLDASTGKWETLRDITGNSSSSTILGVGSTTTATAVRITAKSTNAEDGKFRLLDVQCLESTGLASKLSKTLNSLTDVVDGYFTKANETVEEKIADLEEQMERINERLETKEASLWTKFNNMESALSILQNQSNYLTTMFSSMSGSSSNAS